MEIVNMETLNNGKIGKTNKKGKEITSSQYTCIEPFVNSSKLFKVMENDKWGIIDAKSSIVVPLIYDEIGDLFKDYVIIKQNGYFGVINLQGEFIIPNEYDKIDRTCHSRNCFYIGPHSEYFAVLKNKKWEYIIANNENRNNTRYDWVSGPWINNEYIVKKENNYGIVNRLGEIIVPITYSKICVESDRVNLPHYVLKIKGQKPTIIPFYNDIDIAEMQKMRKVQIDKYNSIEKKITEEFEIVEPINKKSGFYIVKEANKMGVITSHDDVIEIIVPVEYDEIKVLFTGIQLLVAQKSGKNRIMKITKNLKLFSPFYDKIGQFNYIGYAPVYKDNHVGVINTMIEEIIPPKYDMLEDDAIQAFTIGINGKERSDAIVMKKNDKLGLLKNTGELLLPFEYDEIDYRGMFYRIPEHILKRQLIITPGDQKLNTALIPVKKNKKWGLVDINFKIVVPCLYRAILEDSVNKLELKKEKGHDLLIMEETGPRIEYLSTEKLDFYSKVGKFKEGFAKVEKDGKYGVIDEEYNEVISCVFEEISPFLDDIAIVRKNGKYGCVDNEGHEIVSCIYDNSIEFNRGVAIVERDGLMGVINKRGEVTVPIMYPILSDLSMIGPTLLLAAKNDKSLGVIDKNNKIIVPFEFEYEEVLPMFGMITLKKHGKKCLYNHKGELVIPFLYDDIRHPSMSDTIYCVCNDGKWGVVNKNGIEIVPPKYDQIEGCRFACGRLAVCNNGKWGFINRKGEEVIPCVYDKVIQWFEEDHCEVKLNGKSVTIDVYGNTI